MKRILVVLLAVMLVSSIGCSNDQSSENDQTVQADAKKVSGGSLVDPVDKKPVDFEASKYSFIYKEIEYNFNSKENFEAFMKDPESYLKKD